MMRNAVSSSSAYLEYAKTARKKNPGPFQRWSLLSQIASRGPFSRPNFRIGNPMPINIIRESSVRNKFQYFNNVFNKEEDGSLTLASSFFDCTP